MRDPNKDSNIIQGFYAVDKQSFSDLKPSLILHLYQHNFAFENVPGSFPYDAMMESFLSAIDSNVNFFFLLQFLFYLFIFYYSYFEKQKTKNK